MTFAKLKNGLALLICAALSGCDSVDHEIGDHSDELRGVVATDFELGITVADSCDRDSGVTQYTPSVESGGGSSHWACDQNCYDPDTAQLELRATASDEVMNKDIRICMQAADGGFKHVAAGSTRCTAWASAPGPRTTGAVSDENNHDPDSYRVMIETRPWPAGAPEARLNYRFRLRAWDGGIPHEWSEWTGWASEGGGVSSWARDDNCYDPDAFELEMGVDIEEG